MVLVLLALVAATFSAIRRLPRLACFCPKKRKPYTKAIYNVVPLKGRRSIALLLVAVRFCGSK